MEVVNDGSGMGCGVQLLHIAYQRMHKVLLRPDGRYSQRDQHPSGFSGQRGEAKSFLEF